MAFTKTTKVVTGVTAGLVVAGLFTKYALPKLTKLKNISSNIAVKVLFDRIHGLAKNASGQITGALRMILNVSIKNFSGFDLEINNVFATVEASSDNGNTWVQVADSPKRIDKILIKDGSTSIGKFAIDLESSAIGMLGNKNVKYKIITTYDFNELQQKQETVLDLTTARNNAAAYISKLVGGKGTGLVNNVISNLKKKFGFAGIETSFSSTTNSLM